MPRPEIANHPLVKVIDQRLRGGNVYISPGRRSAIVATDTLAAHLDGSNSHTAKYAVLESLKSVLTVRGSTAFLPLIEAAVASSSLRDFDALSAALPQICRGAAAGHVATLAPLTGALAPELTALGWSTSVGGYACRRFCHASDFEPGPDQEPGCSASPAPPGTFIPPQATEPETGDFVAMAELQIARTCQQHGPDACRRLGTGGMLVVIQLSASIDVQIQILDVLSGRGSMASEAAGPWWRGVIASSKAAA